MKGSEEYLALSTGDLDAYICCDLLQPMGFYGRIHW